MGAFPPQEVEAVVMGGATARRSAEGVTARFDVGDNVVARHIHGSGHTRLPGYAQGKPGVIARVQGVFVFPDSNAVGDGEQPHYVYAVRFAARDLWGAGAPPRDGVYIDVWDSQLDPAQLDPT